MNQDENINIKEHQTAYIVNILISDLENLDFMAGQGDFPFLFA